MAGRVLQKQMLRPVGWEMFIRNQQEGNKEGNKTGHRKKSQCDAGLAKPWLAQWEALE